MISIQLPLSCRAVAPWIRQFTTIISAWWLQTSSKLIKKRSSNQKTWKLATLKQVKIHPKYSAIAPFSWQEDKNGANKQMNNISECYLTSTLTVVIKHQVFSNLPVLHTMVVYVAVDNWHTDEDCSTQLFTFVVLERNMEEMANDCIAFSVSDNSDSSFVKKWKNKN